MRLLRRPWHDDPFRLCVHTRNSRPSHLLAAPANRHLTARITPQFEPPSRSSIGSERALAFDREELTTSQQVAGKKQLAGHAVMPVLDQLTTSLQWPFIPSCDSPTNPDHESAAGAFRFTVKRTLPIARVPRRVGSVPSNVTRISPIRRSQQPRSTTHHGR